MRTVCVVCSFSYTVTIKVCRRFRMKKKNPPPPPQGLRQWRRVLTRRRHLLQRSCSSRIQSVYVDGDDRPAVSDNTYAGGTRAIALFVCAGPDKQP